MAVNFDYPRLVNMWRKIICPGNSLCYLCDGPVGHFRTGLCAFCIADLPVNEPACPLCAVPMPGDYRCPACIEVSSVMVPRIYSAYRYEYPVNRMIWAMKYKSRPDLAHCLGWLLGQAIISRRLLRPECLIPVPLHHSRLISRGYNQSLEIARAVSRSLRIPLDIESCRRTRKALPQAGMAAHKRRANIRGAFIVTRPLCYTHVALVDDVVTTGSTVYELADVLYRAGVSQIDVWTCARTAGGA